MKHYMIKYQFANGTLEEWHREIAQFIAALDNDPELKGKIIYRVMRNRDDASYYHLAAAADGPDDELAAEHGCGHLVAVGTALVVGNRSAQFAPSKGVACTHGGCMMAQILLRLNSISI